MKRFAVPLHSYYTIQRLAVLYNVFLNLRRPSKKRKPALPGTGFNYQGLWRLCYWNMNKSAGSDTVY